MRRAAILLLFALPAFAAEPSKFTLAQSGATADPLTVLGPAAVCADNQVARWDGASATKLQCSTVTIDDTNSEARFGEVVVGIDYINLRNSGGIGWASVGTTNTGALFGDVRLYREYAGSATGTLAQRSGTTPQKYNLYGTADAFTTFTNTNFARLSLAATDGTITIAAETAGTAADDQSIDITPAGVGTLNLTRTRLVPSAAPPVTCAAGTEGALYLDSDTHKLCYCNATGWVLASDDTTGCS